MPKRTQGFDPRQNMKGESYEVFHYLDPKTRHLEAHFHDFYEIFFLVKGDIDYWVDGSLYHLMEGDVLLISPTELHKPIPRSTDSNYERMVLWINKNYLSNIAQGQLKTCFDSTRPNFSKVIRPTKTEQSQITALLSRLVSEFYGNDYARDICTYAILCEFLTFINRLALFTPEKDAGEYSSPTFVTEILSYINENFSTELSLDLLASHFFVSKYHLSHEFKRSVGTGVHQYITLKRLNMAYSLLSEGIPAASAAALCGFKDYTSFFRAFKQEFGQSPASVQRSS